MIHLNSTVFVGIDFSINSPGMCIFDGLMNQYKFISFTNDNPEKLKKDRIPNSLKTHKSIQENSLAQIIFYNRRKRHEKYSIDQYQKTEDSVILANRMITEINKNVVKPEALFLGIEGYSYGSKGNAFIDLISFNSVLRSHIYYEYAKNDKTQRLFVFPPSEIKKFAGKGNANKRLMFEFWLKNKIEDNVLQKHPFYIWCKEQNFDENIPKPIDDLVDAYWVCKYLIDKIPAIYQKESQQ